MLEPLVPLSRGEFWGRLGLLDEIDPLTDLAYRFYEQEEAGRSNKGVAAKDNWHVSFHGSAFPGKDERACGRAAVYTLLDLPKGMFGRAGRQIMEAGKDIENNVVMKWHKAGYLMSSPPYPGVTQTQFEDPNVWLTSTVDAIVLWPRQTQSIVAELKTKYEYAIQEMRNLTRGPDAKHLNQIGCQIGLAHEAGPEVRWRCYNSERLGIPINPKDPESNWICPEHKHGECLHEVEILPPDHGFIYYISRDKPTNTHSFYVEYDPEFMRQGRARLAEWRKAFEENRLPQTHFGDKRYEHPFGWKWGDLPCRWCDHGDTCRRDMKVAKETKEPIKLDESAATEEARYLVPDYSLERVRSAVHARWPKSDDSSS